MAQIGDLNEFTEGTKIQALALNSNYVEISNKYNAHENAITGVHGVSSPNYIVTKNYIDSIYKKYFPIGGLEYVWDNNSSLVQALIDTTYMIEMDGSTVSDASSLYNTITLPNMTEVYIVGAEISFDTSTTGSNSLDLEHLHTNTHTHTLGNHRHFMSHSHIPAVDLQVNMKSSSGELYLAKTTSNSTDATHYLREVYTGTTGNSESFSTGIPSLRDDINTYPNFDTSYTGYNTTASGNNSTTNSTTELSSTTDINLVNLKCRCFLRYK